MNAVNSPETSLEGKVAIVTGAGSGLGKFEAIGLAKAGASLVVNDLAPNEAVEATLEEIRGLGAKVEFVAGNVGERSTADALMEAAQGQFGSVDIVVNNAGVVTRPDAVSTCPTKTGISYSKCTFAAISSCAATPLPTGGRNPRKPGRRCTGASSTLLRRRVSSDRKGSPTTALQKPESRR